MNVWLTVPTAGNRDSLIPLIALSGIDLLKTVIVQTELNAPVVRNLPGPVGAILCDVERPRNISRWWNRGIAYARSQGADVVIVVNDDVRPGESLMGLADALAVSGAALAHPDVAPMTGWCFALKLSAWTGCPDIFDERYQWWYGDNELWIRARSGRGIARVPLKVTHLNQNPGHLLPWQAELVAQDQALFRRESYVWCLDGWREHEHSDEGDGVAQAWHDGGR